MADRALVRNLCKSLFSSRFSSLNAKSVRYFTRYLSSRASNLRGEEESRISVITDGCSVEELENVQDLVDGNLEVRDDFISKEEESLLLKEVEPYLKRQKYQYDHWDDVSTLAVWICLLREWVCDNLSKYIDISLPLHTCTCILVLIMWDNLPIELTQVTPSLEFRSKLSLFFSFFFTRPP